MKKLLATLLMSASWACCGALSPLNQSIREMEEILKSKELQNYLHQNDPIVEMKREGMSYLVRTEKSQVRVDVIPIPSLQKIGPKEFKLIFR